MDGVDGHKPNIISILLVLFIMLTLEIEDNIQLYCG